MAYFISRVDEVIPPDHPRRKCMTCQSFKKPKTTNKPQADLFRRVNVEILPTSAVFNHQTKRAGCICGLATTC